MCKIIGRTLAALQTVEFGWNIILNAAWNILVYGLQSHAKRKSVALFRGGGATARPLDIGPLTARNHDAGKVYISRI